MAKAEAAVPRHSDPAMLEDCPVLTGEALAEYRASVRAASDFSVAMLKFLGRKAPRQRAAWVKTSVSGSRALMQPWAMELLFVVAVLGRARFGELQGSLGLSSRTLSDKLRALREEGFLAREVFDEQPVRVEYVLTKEGRVAAALASPLFAALNLQALRRAGRLPARGR